MPLDPIPPLKEQDDTFLTNTLCTCCQLVSGQLPWISATHMSHFPSPFSSDFSPGKIHCFKTDPLRPVVGGGGFWQIATTPKRVLGNKWLFGQRRFGLKWENVAFWSEKGLGRVDKLQRRRTACMTALDTTLGCFSALCSNGHRNRLSLFF